MCSTIFIEREVMRLIVYIPTTKNGANVLAVDTKQLHYISKSQFMIYDIENGHRKIRVYSAEFVFNTADGAWRFLFGKMFKDTELLTIVDLFPDRKWDRNILTAKEKKAYDRIKNQEIKEL